ncbi:hypothetical protein EUX98_g8836 [Antrodiella citrinella]|uniref:Uncharacterized protein n=1 Tax=Antrodiella citrinella TaxID=2447956 RepID=A0A4S4M3Z6_9APHY|nr:hypothetical protein EUX98_g8836 [Antrodiella citrinella]
MNKLGVEELADVKRFKNSRFYTLQQNLEKHIGAAMAKHQGTISMYARKYNVMCKEMQSLITKGQAPKNAIALLEIKLEGLFKMDIDHSIWHNLGFNDADVEVPRWLADESIRNGIRYWLELDRCEEELDRLRFERCGLQEWFMVDWQGLRCVKEKVSEHSIMHQLNLCEVQMLNILIK